MSTSKARVTRLRRALGGILLLPLAALPLRADVPSFTAARMQPVGAQGLAALLAGEDLTTQAPQVRMQVAQQGFFTGEALGTSDCAGCHSEIAAQWAQSAHHFSSFNNPYYAASVDLLRTQRPLAAGRFCAGCHDPLLLVDDRIAATDLRRDQPAAQAGLPCLVCHSMQQTQEVHAGPRARLGNGAYDVVASSVPPPVGDAAGTARDSSEHTRRLRPAHMAQPTFCAACHKVGLEPAITHTGWLRGQDDYGAWLASMASGNGVGAVYRPEHVQVKRCQDCHMPLEPLRSGRLVRSHRFLAANTALAALRGDPDMLAREQQFLQGAVSVDIALWPAEPTSVAADSDRAQPSVAAPVFDPQLVVGGQGRLRFDVVLRNRRVGHRFPGGTNDSNDVWVEVSLGRPGRAPVLVDGTHLVRAQPVDEQGQPLQQRDPQNTRAVVYNTSIAPADPQVVRYEADLGPIWHRLLDDTANDVNKHAAPQPLELIVRLRYRKFTPEYAAFSCQALPAGPTRQRCLVPPVVDVAQATRWLWESRPQRQAPLSAHGPQDREPLWERFLDHGIGLADGLVDAASAAAPSLDRAQTLAPDRPEPLIAAARLALALGRTEDVLLYGAKAEALRAAHPAHLWLRGQALYRSYRFTEARPYLERAVRLVPQDPALLSLLARVRGLTGDPQAALSAADRLLVLDPESEEAHHQRMLALRELGRYAESEQAERSFLYYRRPVEVDQDLRQRFRAHDPARIQEDALAHTHELSLARSPVR